MSEKEKTKIFEAVRDMNKKYAKAVDANASKEAQEILLEGCRKLFEAMIFQQGLVNEYWEYCKKKALQLLL